MGFEGKSALVTGGASGIGLAVAEGLVTRGATVYLADINRKAGAAAAERLNAAGAARFVELDVTADHSIEQAARAVTANHPVLDILVNCAGWSKIERFVDGDMALWQRLIDINFVGTLKVTRAFLAPMVARGGGKIVNVASDSGRVGNAGEAVYSGAKGGIIAFTKALARETARNMINVNCVCPGPTDTPLLESVPDKYRESLLRVIPFRRFGKPSDVAAAVLFFAGDEASYITGQVLSVSGGLTMVD